MIAWFYSAQLIFATAVGLLALGLGFAKRNREAIAEMARQQADDFGTGVVEMIRGFGCFRNGTKPTDSEIGTALYAGKDDGAGVLNALAWYAGEEVCRSYCDLSGEND